MVRRIARLLNVIAALVCLASALAVAGSWVIDPGYRAHYRDAPWLIAVYIAFYAWTIRSFVRDDAWVPRLAVAKMIGAYLFIALFVVVGPLWMIRTPGRYVYQVFQATPGYEEILIAYVFLARGLWNTGNALYFTGSFWVRLRTTRPLLGRAISAIPLAAVVMLMITYRELVRIERETYSREATLVAEQIAATETCTRIRERSGKTTEDRRRREDREYAVRVRWDCRDLQVLVEDPDGRIGNVRVPRTECCG